MYDEREQERVLTSRRRQATGTASTAAAALLYAGMAIGVSFIATPAKFLATTSETAQLLEVGRWTFYVFGWVEIAAAAVVVVLGVGALRGWRGALPWMVALIVAVQFVILRPPLDERVSMIMAGTTPPPSLAHQMYSVLEIVKIVLLILVGVVALRRGP